MIMILKFRQVLSLFHIILQPQISKPIAVSQHTTPSIPRPLSQIRREIMKAQTSFSVLSI